MGIFWAMTRRPLIASLLTLAACGGSEGRVPATCGLAAVAAASTLVEQFTVTGRTLSSPPASLPEHPERSKRRLVAIGMPVGGVLVALLILLLRPLRDGRIYTAREAAFWANMPVVSSSAWPRTTRCASR